MTDQPITIWHQSMTVLDHLPAYQEALGLHFEKIARSDTSVALHGMHPSSYETNYPGHDIRHSYLQNLHAQQFVANAIEAEEKGFDAFALMTLPEPLLLDIRSVVDIPVVGYCESAILVSVMLGARFGVLHFIAELSPHIEKSVARAGLSDRLVGARGVGFGFQDVLDAYDDPDQLITRFCKAARRLIADGAEVIIPGEAPLCLLLAKNGLAEVDGVPVVDATAATIKAAEMMVDLRRKSAIRPCQNGYFNEQPPRERTKELLRLYGIASIAGACNGRGDL